MLSITAVSGADYYLRSACQHPHDRPAKGPADYELDAASAGEPVGVWAFRGEQTLPLEGSIVPEKESGNAFRMLLNELRDPTSPKVWEQDPPPNGQRHWRKDQTPTGAWRHPRLGEAPREFKTLEQRLAQFDRKHPDATPEERRDFKIRAQKDERHARNGYDLQFSAPKSWSVLHAAWQAEGRNREADLLWAALMKGVDAALDVVADQLSYTRSGAGGPKIAGRATTRFTRNRNLILGIFRHHTSRSREPQLHTHVLLLNRLLCEDGEWRALHAAQLFKSRHMLTQTFLRVAEAEATRTLGLRFATDPESKWREIVGVDREVRALFSSRSRALSEQAREWRDQYEAENRAAPDAFTQWKMNQRAAYKTRPEKAKNPPTRGEELESWHDRLAEDIADGLSSVTQSVDWEREHAPGSVERLNRGLVIEQALAELTKHMPTWSRSHLWHTLARRMPDMVDVSPEDMPALLEGLTDEALRGAEVLSVEAPSVVTVPHTLRDPRSGRSVFEDPQGKRFTTRAHKEREDLLVARLDQRGAKAVPAGSVRASIAGLGLPQEQEDVVVGIRSSDRRLELVDKPAGAGGSRTMAALSTSLEQDTGRGVVGFALARNAAEVLKREGIQSAHNIAAWLLFWDRLQAGEVSDVERAHYMIAPGSTVVLDEATMADTPQLSRLVRVLLDEVRVDRIVLVGDTEQVDSPDAGGAFAMLVRERQEDERLARKFRAEDFAPQAADFVWPARKPELVPVHRLREVRRFTNSWEREASSRVRDGDVTALGQYDTRGRVMGDADPEVVKDAAVDGFVTDYLAGLDSIVVVASQDEAADVSSRVRQRLIDLQQVEAEGVALHDDTTSAGIGDLIQTRQNDDSIGVNNRDRWLVVGSTSDGDLEVRQMLGRGATGQIEWGPQKALPASYVEQFVELAYAGTVEAVQGRTTDTGHALVGRTMGRSRFYPATTRGRTSNHVYVELDAQQREAIERAQERVTLLKRKLRGLTSEVNRELLEGSVQEARDDLAALKAREETPIGRLAEVVAKDDHTQAARSAIAEEKARATHLGHLGPQWQALVTEDRAADHRRVIQVALKEDSRRVLADPAVNGLLHLLRSAEMSGRPVRALLDEAMQAGDLGGAESPAAVLFSRVDASLRRRPWEQQAREGGYEFRSPRAPKTPEGEYARRLGRVMDERVAELGKAQADEPEPWALARFGPVPQDEADRAQWIANVAAVAAFREQFGWHHESMPIGPAPTRQNPEKLWAWNRAADRLGMDPRERDLAAMSDGELENVRQAWQRHLEWIPRNVDMELREAHQDWRRAQREFVDARARGRESVDLEAKVLSHEAEVRTLERVAEVRAQAYTRTTPERVAAEEAGNELFRRYGTRDGIPLPPEPDVESDEVDAEAEAEAEQRAIEDAEADARARVFWWWSSLREPVGEREVPQFGSEAWVALPTDDPAKQAAAADFALARWRMGAPVDREALAEQLAELEADVEPWVDLDPDVLSAMGEWAKSRLDGVEGKVPAIGSPEWAALAPDDPRREAAAAAAALEEWGMGDTLTARQERLDYVLDRQSSHDIAADLVHEREEAHRQRVEAERVARIAEERQERTAWLMPTPRAVEDREADRWRAEPESTLQDPEASDTEREIARIYLDSQGIEPAAVEAESDEPVVWPEPAPIPEPEAETGAEPAPRSTEVESPHLEEPTVADPEPEREPYREPEPVEPEPEVDDEEARFQEGLKATLAAAERQREADEAAQREAEQQQAARDAEERAEAEREAAEAAEVDERAAKDARYQADLEAAERAAELMREREAEEQAAAWQPEPEPEPAAEVEAEVEV